MSDSAPCTLLQWDSDFFGRRIARFDGHQLDAVQLPRTSKWCHQHAIDCLYFLADPNHSQTIVLLEEWKARMVDIRVTMRSRYVPESEPMQVIRHSTDEDLPRLSAIARESHRDGRFFFDRGFPSERCESLYETWIRRSHDGFADAVLVADSDGQAAGYASCHVDVAGAGRIGLFAVAADMRGRGVGRTLVRGAMDWFARKGVDRVDMVTQGRNVPAQRLYAKCGFELHSLFIWYHKWFTDE